MPRGDNPNSRANLKMFGNEREPRENGRNGGIASGKSRRIHKTFREMDAEVTTDDEILQMLAMVKKMGVKGSLPAIKLYMEMTGMDNSSTSEEVEDDGLLSALKSNTEDLFSDGDDSCMIEQEE